MTQPGQSPGKPLKTRCPSGFRGYALLAALSLSGCASQGPLRPPSLHLPAPVRGLVASRAGDAVDLRWTNATRTTDGIPLNGRHVPGPLQVEICREAASAICSPLRRVPAASSSTGSFHDVLPVALASGTPRLLRYRVRMLNGDGKGAAPASVETLAGSAPATLEKVQAAPAEHGVLIRWQTDSSTDNARVLLRVRRGAPADAAPTPGGEAKNSDTLLAVPVQAGDPAGTLDTGAKPGVAQHYSIVREQTVHLAGRDFSMTGTAVTVSVAADAKLPPPAPPAGLEAVVNTLGAPEVDLVWQPVAAATGYVVYRAEVGGTPVALTAAPVQGLSYTDRSLSPGRTYRYSVSAVGRDGVAGPRGSEVEEQVPVR